MDTDDLQWEPPGPGQWYASAEHMPLPVSRLYGELLPHAGRGWGRGAARYGLPPNDGAFGVANCWGYYSPGVPGRVDLDALDRAAEETLATNRWRADIRRWHDEVRPAVVAANRALLAVDLAALTDAELAVHVQDAIDHFVEVSPLHFAAFNEGAASAGALLLAARDWELDPQAVVEALAGSAPASSSAARVLERIAEGLRAAGHTELADVDTIRAVGGDAAAALDELLVDYGWRLFSGDVTEPTLAERPEAIVAAVRGALAGWGPRQPPTGAALDALRAQVPEADRPRFDELVVDARAGYGCNDDNSVVLFSLPIGLVRRAALEVGRRLHERDRLHHAADVFDAEPAELVALLTGAGPSADELAARARFRAAMADVRPPPVLGDAPSPAPPLELPPHVRRLEEILDAFRHVAWARTSTPGRAAATVGTQVVRGRAVVVVDPTEALARMEPGNVLVALTTSAPFNTVFPVAGAVAVQEGGLMSHAAVLARELGLTAVIGVPDLLTRVADGDLVEVDPVAGTIRVLQD